MDKVEVYTIIYNSALDQFYVEHNFKNLDYYTSLFMVIVQQLTDREAAYALIQDLNSNSEVKALMKESYGLKAQIDTYKNPVNTNIQKPQLQVSEEVKTLNEPTLYALADGLGDEEAIPETNAIGVTPASGETFVIQFNQVLKDVNLMYNPLIN